MTIKETNLWQMRPPKIWCYFLFKLHFPSLQECCPVSTTRISTKNCFNPSWIKAIPFCFISNSTNKASILPGL